jgi:hypothetical protein
MKHRAIELWKSVMLILSYDFRVKRELMGEGLELRCKTVKSTELYFVCAVSKDVSTLI